jgi:bifunctional UDP-N-acetylglucosamine pyrophosphorylase / glucosamine-1-phosphate N-acetyltransferase
MASQIRPVSAVVLAAGEGTRMRSSTPKVLHPLCGRPMLLHVLDALEALPLSRIVVVVGHAAEDVTKTLQEQVTGDVPVEFVEQHKQRGTGDAVSVALSANANDLDLEDEDLIIVMGDAPLLRAETLAMLATEHRHADAAASLLTARVADPTGYGRIVRDEQGRVVRIVEQADADPDELEIDEINPSIYCFRRGFLAPALRRLSPENAQGEYYLTDVVEVLRQAGHVVLGVEAPDPTEAVGVNDRAQLAEAEAVLRSRINLGWMRAGVGMTDPSRTYLDTTVVLAPDVQLLPGTILEGRTTVGRGSVLGPDTHLVDTVVGEDAVVRQAVAREAEIGDGATVGPYASLRPGTRLAAGAHVGTFVEIKNSEIGEDAKVPHLAYVGDAEIGPRANIGAGTITANYDGRRKHRTKVGADARTGSNTVLVAPVEVGDGAYTGAGSVVTRDVPPGALAKGVPATIEEGWVAKREDATSRNATSRNELGDGSGGVGAD